MKYLPLLFAALFFLSGCNADARTRLATANQAKATLNTTFEAAIDTGVYVPSPDAAQRILAASEAVDAALDAAALRLNPDGTAAGGFQIYLDAAMAAIDRLRVELDAAGVPLE